MNILLLEDGNSFRNVISVFGNDLESNWFSITLHLQAGDVVAVDDPFEGKIWQNLFRWVYSWLKVGRQPFTFIQEMAESKWTELEFDAWVIDLGSQMPACLFEVSLTSKSAKNKIFGNFKRGNLLKARFSALCRVKIFSLRCLARFSSVFIF